MNGIYDGYTKELISSLLNQKQTNQLNNLADRGIFLNRYQVNEMFIGGRAHGKTTLAFV